jgi:predicted DNA-binding protein (UPF0251 family)
MPRPWKTRYVQQEPRVTVFKPAGIPADGLAAIELGVDELEALRLADVEGHYQDAAAEQMGVSRATFARVLAAARTKVARALTEGAMLVVAGGPAAQAVMRRFHCTACDATIELAFGSGRPDACPKCGQDSLVRMDGCGGRGGRRRRGRGCGRGGGQPGGG